MNISSFEDLLHAANAQPQPQRLLFVFANAGLPDDATPAQRARFEAGEGGTLVPLMAVDKAPEELQSFPALVEEARQYGSAWSIVFVAGLAGRNACAPTSDEADRSLERMVEAVKAGEFGAFMPFDRQGNPLLID